MFTRLLTLVATSVVLGVGAAVAFADAGLQPPAAPGESPTFQRDRCGKPPCTKPVVVASGILLDHPTEIVAHTEDARTYFEGDTFYRSGPFAPFAAGPPENVPPKGRALSFLSWYGFDRVGHSTHVIGLTRADVATVRVRYRSDGAWHQARSLFNLVEEKLLDKTGTTEPFGIFATSVHRCVDARRFRAVALDARDHRLGATRFPHPDFVYACHRKDLNPAPSSVEVLYPRR